MSCARDPHPDSTTSTATCDPFREQALVTAVLPLLAGRDCSRLPHRGVGQHDGGGLGGNRALRLLPRTRPGDQGVPRGQDGHQPRETREEDQRRESLAGGTEGAVPCDPRIFTVLELHSPLVGVGDGVVECS